MATLRTMPYLNLSPLEQNIARRLAKGLNLNVIAAELEQPQQTVYAAVQDGRVHAAVLEIHRQELSHELTPLALKRWKQILNRDPKTDAQEKLQAEVAGKVLDRAGLSASIADKRADPGARDISDMSLDELESALNAIKRKRADKARPVIDVAPADAPGVDDISDIIG